MVSSINLISLGVLFYAITLIGSFYNYLTQTEGWYQENWSTFFKRQRNYFKNC